MDRDAPILVTGASGMVGGALVRRLRADGYTRVLAPRRAELDLADRAAVLGWFAQHKPRHVFMLAARVGGIAANIADPVGFLDENLRIELNLYAAAQRHGAGKCLYLGSSCVYPRECPQPMREEHLLTGPLEPTNEGYALAKIAGLRMAVYLQRQHGLQTVCPLPCNIYGTGDHFDLQRSHVLSALVRRFVDAQDARAPSVTLWGTGAARREFIHVDDVVAGMLFFMEHVETAEHVNLGPGTDVSIRELAQLVARQAGYTGAIQWDSSKPDGMPRKLMDVTRLKALGFAPAIGLEAGVERTLAEYRTLKAQGAVAA
jgi:GDP-L-fucose synthase